MCFSYLCFRCLAFLNRFNPLRLKRSRRMQGCTKTWQRQVFGKGACKDERYLKDHRRWNGTTKRKMLTCFSSRDQSLHMRKCCRLWSRISGLSLGMSSLHLRWLVMVLKKRWFTDSYWGSKKMHEGRKVHNFQIPLWMSTTFCSALRVPQKCQGFAEMWHLRGWTATFCRSLCFNSNFSDTPALMMLLAIAVRF